MWTKTVAWAATATIAFLVAAAALVVLARPLMLLLIAVAVVAAVLCTVSPRFARWFESLGGKPPANAGA